VTGSASFEALGTTATVVVSNPGDVDRAARLLELELDAVDRACSRFRGDSELVHVNASAGRPVEVSPLLATAVSVALDAARQTDGLVSPTLGVPLRVAGYDRTIRLVRARGGFRFDPVPPTPDAWRRVLLDENTNELTVPPGVELDLGATAKALAADRASTRIAGELSSGVLVSLGGDIAVAGEPPRGGWPVRISDDHTAPLETPGPVVVVASGGLATSSTTTRRWSTSRGEAHHVLDPATALPAETVWRTVSVAAPSCVRANVAATAALVLSDEAPRWLEERSLPARLVGVDGDVVRVGGWPAEREAAAC